MSDVFQSFDARLKKIDRKRSRLSRGYVSQVGRDGLIVLRPKRRQRSFPLRGLTFLIVGFFCFKGLIRAHLGSTLYEQRVETLNSGSIVEQIGAFVMQTDPVTQSISSKIRPLLR